MIDSFDEIIPTAIQGASLKTFTDIPYSKEVLREAKKYDTLPTDIIVDKKSIIREARHKIIDELLLKNDASQILEIAAGYSPRGLIFTQDPKRQIVELDLPVVAQNKQKIVAGIESGRQNLHIIGGNALDESAFSATAQYFNGKNRSLS
jgi:O-methyltransferase involved in polyketide biosynthesis